MKTYTVISAKLHFRFISSILFFGLLSLFCEKNKVIAQHWIQVTPEDGFLQQNPWVLNSGVKVPCPGNDCDHDNFLDFKVTEDLLTIGGHIYIGEWFSFTNHDPSCSGHFVLCSMVQYKRPYGSSQTIMTQGWEMTRDPSDPDSKFQKPCTYTCQALGAKEAKDYWSFYLGCKEINLAPGQTTWAFDGYHDVTSFIPNGVILNNKTKFDVNDHTSTTWNFNGQYTDFQEGCSMDEVSCAGLINQPGHEVSDVINGGKRCGNNGWQDIGGITRTGGSGSSLVSKVGFPTGNQATMYTMHAYPATFHGILINAPAGTELRFWVPGDTMSGMTVVDSGRIFTDTLSGCLSDTLGFSFPFLIPPMDDPGMLFKITVPNACSNVENGRTIELRAEVFSRSTTPEYDSGAFMYWIDCHYIRDTTPPSILNFALHQIDSNKLEIRLQGSEDVSMIDKGYVLYRINGGSEQGMVLRYESNDSVDKTTKFIDTLISTISHPLITLRGYVGNQLDLLDSTGMDSCQLLFPLSVEEKKGSNLSIKYLYIDHDSKKLIGSIDVRGFRYSIDIVTVDGKSRRIVNQQIPAIGEQHISQSLQELARGTYFIVIRAAGELVVKRIIL